MKQMVIGYTWGALKPIIEPWNNWSKLQTIGQLTQHKILINNAIEDYYYSCVSEAEIDDLQSYLSGFGGDNENAIIYDGFGSTITDVFYNCLKNVRKKQHYPVAYVYDTGETVYDNKTSVVSTCLSEIDFQNVNQMVALYSANNEFNLKIGEPVTPYLEFMQYMIRDEQYVVFIDPYILTNKNSVKNLCNDLLPFISEQSKVDIYCDINNVDRNNLDYVVSCMREKKIHGFVYAVPSEYIHDRYIIVDQRKLVLGKGLDFYKHDLRVVNSGGSFSYSMYNNVMFDYYEFAFDQNYIDERQYKDLYNNKQIMKQVASTHI